MEDEAADVDNEEHGPMIEGRWLADGEWDWEAGGEGRSRWEKT